MILAQIVLRGSLTNNLRFVKMDEDIRPIRKNLVL